MVTRGLFVGLVTLDFLYLTDRLPEQNQKMVACDYTLAAGGPATNAAVAFRYFGQAAILLGVLGQHPLSTLIQVDLQQWGVTLLDLDPDRLDPPPTSSIFVTRSTGDRAVVSINAARSQASVNAIPDLIWDEIEIVLVDGHQMAVGQAIIQQAKVNRIPIVLDGGSWKPGLEALLPQVDYAICSANFYPPACHDPSEVVNYLQAHGVPHIAITQGEQPIQFWDRGHSGHIAVPTVPTVDTLGAGDILHGSFCYYIQRMSFPEALRHAAGVASRSCQEFGTRQWMISE